MAQQIKGSVKDSKNKTIENVSIGTLNLKNPIGTSSNNKGEYSLKLTPDREYIIRFSCIGYKDFDTIVKIEDKQTLILDIVLQNASTTLEGVEIKGDYSREEGVTRISSDWAKTTAGPTGGVENVIKTIEGLIMNYHRSIL